MNLEPGHGYIIRIVATNESNFQAGSDPIRVTTRPSTSADFLSEHIKLGEDDDGEEQKGVIPVVRPFKTPVEPVATVPAAPAMTREHSNSLSQQKRVGTGKKQTSGAAEHILEDEPLESEGTLRELTEQLDKLRDENDKIEIQINDEEEDFKVTQATLSEQRDNLKNSLNVKEGASKKLRQRVAKLDHENTAAISKKSALERQFQQKQQEREKLQADMQKWDKEIEDNKAEVERWEREKAIYRNETDQKISDLREKHASEVNANKALEESIKAKVSQIKELEDEKKRLDQQDEAVTQLPLGFNQEEDTIWQMRLAQLRGSYNEAWQALQAAQAQHRQAQQSLEFWMQRRASNPHLFAISTNLDLAPGRRSSQRRARAPSLRNEAGTQTTSFDVSSAPPFNTSMASISPNYSTVSPFFNKANGMTLPPAPHMAGMTQTEIDQLIGGAPTSPSVAGALLPAGLLGDEAEPPKPEPQPPRTGTSSNRNSRVIDDFPNSNLLPGLGAAQILDQAKDPSSPVSIHSRSPSVFASPRESSTHLPFLPPGPPESLIDSDRRSTRSTTGSGRGIGPPSSTGTRFANLFGFNRQRGKTFSDEGLALGTLKVSESQSYPRQDLLDQDPVGTRRRGSHSGNWTDSLHGVFSRSSGASTGPDAPTRRSRFNMFSSKTDSWASVALNDRPGSPRQGSTASSETNLLPRPSTDGATRFGWTSTVDALGQRHSPLAMDWGMTATNSWSRHPSRRPSLQYGSSLSLGQEPSIFEGPGDVDLQPEISSPKQAPIGTRPSSSRTDAEKPKLNPEAKSFKTIFSRSDRKEKVEKSESVSPEDTKESKKGKKSKAKDKSKTKDIEDAPKSKAPTTPDLRGGGGDDKTDSPSPESSRKSKDAARSTSTAGGDTDGTIDYSLRDSSFEMLGRQTSHTLSEATASASSNAPKESFMQKLSRKSSTSMFSLRFSKSKGGKEVSEAYDTPEETDEEGQSGFGLSRSMDSREPALVHSEKEKTPRESKEKERSGGFSFRSLTRRDRKGEKTPSLHESLAGKDTSSEAGEDGDAEREDSTEAES